jgi:CRP-like cAMP-binding protein/chromosome segregation ATPase/rhodanese-related sulfurtransferase
MAVPHTKTDDALLKNLVPLNTLSDEQLGNLLSRIVVEKAKKGDYLFREGDTDHQNIYLLSGTIALLSGQKEMDLVSSGTQTARFALAHQLPRKHSAQARTAVTYVRIDSRMLSDMLARSHSASYEVNLIEEPKSGDWMSLLLQSPVFQQIPPANLQRVMMRMEEIQVSAGDVIISQGDDGDYFYLISKGECNVTRTPEAGHAPVELAKLRAGKGFGEEALISDKPRSSTVTMLSDGILVRLNKQDFIDLVKQPLSRTVSYRDAGKGVEDGALWLDVRTPEEYEAGHLPGAINLPFFSLRFQASSLTMDRPYMIYGAEVGQSATAAYLLTERGAEVFVLDIGWAELAEQAGLGEHVEEALPQVNNVIDFNRDAEDISTIKAQVAAQKAEIENLKHTLSEQKTQFEEELQQRHTEVKLLKQALAVAKSRQENDEQEGKEAEELRQEIDSLRASLQAAEAQAAAHAELQQEHEKLLARLDGLEQHFATAQEELENTRKMGDDFRQQGIDLQSQLQQMQARYDEQKGRLKEEITELSLQLQAVEDNRQESLQQAEQQQAELERLRGELAELQTTSEAFRAQSAEDLSRLSGERFELECALEQLRQEQASSQAGDSERIDSLQLALEQAREALNQAQSQQAQREAALQQELTRANESALQAAEQFEGEMAALRQSQAAAQQALDEARLQLEQSQLEAQQQESALQDALDNANAAASEAAEQSALTIAQLEQQHEALQQQIQAQASAQQAQAEEMQALQAQLQAEINHAGELDQSRQSLEERRRSLEKELESIREAGSDAEAQHHNAMSSLRSDMEQAQQNIDELRQARQQLENALQLTQAEAEALRQQLSEAQEAAGRSSIEEQQRIDAALMDLNSQLKASQIETRKQSDKRVEIEALLEQEHQTASFLRRSLKTAEEAVELTEKRLGEANQSQQTLEGQLAELQQTLANERLEKDQLNDQLQQEIKSGQDAWQQMSDADAALQTAKQELTSVKSELEQEIANLQAQLAHQEENRGATLAEQQQVIDSLKQSLADAEAVARSNESAKDALEEERQILQSAKAELESKLARIEDDIQAKDAELASANKGHEQALQALKTELNEAQTAVQARVERNELEAAQLAQQAAEAKITALMREIEGLREVQLEMGSQLSDDADTEISQLRNALEAEEQKRKKAEKQAQQADVLRRERQVQETAIEMLNDDLEEVIEEKKALLHEKEALAQERDRLTKQMNEIRSQYTDLVSENDQLHSEMSGFREQASDSSLADDLLIQMEALRIKAENYELERDEALSEAKRTRREVGELRSVIETYVEQIQDVQSFGTDEQVAALRSELDMVRRQAHDDLEQMRLHLQDAESRLSDLDTRDVNDVASQQAARQEMFSLQQALSEKDHLLRLSQNQCRGLEDAIEDRDKEVDQLKRKLELLLRKTGGLDDPSLQLGARKVPDSRLRDSSRRGEGNELGGDSDSKRSTFDRLFRKK